MEETRMERKVVLRRFNLMGAFVGEWVGGVVAKGSLKKKGEGRFYIFNNPHAHVHKGSHYFVPTHSKKSRTSTPGLRRCALRTRSSTLRERGCGRSFVTKTC